MNFVSVKNFLRGLSVFFLINTLSFSSYAQETKGPSAEKNTYSKELRHVAFEMLFASGELTDTPQKMKANWNAHASQVCFNYGQMLVQVKQMGRLNQNPSIDELIKFKEVDKKIDSAMDDVWTAWQQIVSVGAPCAVGMPYTPRKFNMNKLKKPIEDFAEKCFELTEAIPYPKATENKSAE